MKRTPSCDESSKFVLTILAKTRSSKLKHSSLIIATMKISAVYLTTLLLFSSELLRSFTEAKNHKDDNEDITDATRLLGDDEVEESVPTSHTIFSRKAHVTLGNLKEDTFTPEEALYLDSALVAAYEASRTADDDVHMVGASIFKRQKLHTAMAGGPKNNLRDLGSPKPKYGNLYRYDYSLFFDPRCNCGSYWNRRALGNFGDFKSFELGFCKMLRTSPYEIFKDVKGCHIRLD